MFASYCVYTHREAKGKLKMDILFGTKIYDNKKQSIGILINTYNLGYVDAPDATGAKVLNPNGKIYPTNLDNLSLINEMTEAEIENLNIPKSFLIN